MPGSASQARQLPIRRSSGSLTGVDRQEFVRLRAALTTNLPPASGALIEAAAARLRQRLVASVMFTQVEVEVTEDPQRLLVAMVRYRPGTPERQVSSFLEAVWISELRLSGLDVFNFLAEDGHVELESVTGDQESGYFLSLHLIAAEGSAADFEDSARHETLHPVETDAPSTKKRWFNR
jgi:hypothetical protein